MSVQLRPMTAGDRAAVEALQGGGSRAVGGEALVAERNGAIEAAGGLQVFGGLGLLGPVRASLRGWSGGARQLLEALLTRAKERGLHAVAAYAPGEAFHLVNLLQSVGFQPRHFVARMVRATEPGPPGLAPGWVRVRPGEEAEGALLAEADRLAGSLTPGFRISDWVRARGEREGEELLAWPGGEEGLEAVALLRPAAEGLEVPLALVRPEAEARFAALLEACERVCAERGASSLALAAHAGNPELYDALEGRGYRRVEQGFALHRPGVPLHFQRGVFALHPWC